MVMVLTLTRKKSNQLHRLADFEEDVRLRLEDYDGYHGDDDEKNVEAPNN